MKISTFILLFALCSVSTFGQTLFTKSEFENQKSCYRIPSIIQTHKGTLLAAADQRNGTCADLIGGDDINIVLRISHDQGKTWTPSHTIVDFPKGQSASDVSMVQDKKTKEIFAFYNFMDLVNSPKEFRLHYVSSKNDGKTWSSPVDITDAIAPEEWKMKFKFITSGRGEYTSKGWILNTLVLLDEGIHVIGSKDHGKTWQRLSPLLVTADESNIVELPNKTWMVNSRVKDHGHRKIFISKDKGQSWEERTETQLEDPTCNASTLVHNKKLYFSNLHVKGSNDRKNLGIKTSIDNGTSWKFLETVEPGSSAYSVLTPITNNKIGILYESVDYRDIVFKVINLK
jgi:sialidase-1